MSLIRRGIRILLLVSVLSVLSGAEDVPQLSSKECAELGFNSGVVQCSDCRVLGASTGEESLAQECARCCSLKSEEKFQLAVLELDSRYAARMKNLGELISQADALNVVVRNRIGARPSLLMYKERDDELPEVELNVFSWTVDIFKEYIADHM
jgi:hypothetical protein